MRQNDVALMYTNFIHNVYVCYILNKNTIAVWSFLSFLCVNCCLITEIVFGYLKFLPKLKTKFITSTNPYKGVFGQSGAD